MKLIYIAGPYTGKLGRTTEQNIENARGRAVQVTVMLAEHNCFPLTPHLNTGLFESLPGSDGLPEEYWYAGAMELLKRADAVLLTFQTADRASKGTKREMAEAEKLGIPVFRSIHQLVQFMEQQV